jgi:hypothetical protein
MLNHNNLSVVTVPCTTAAELDAMFAEDAAAEAAVAEADGDPDAYAMASERYRETYLAIVSARPTDPGSMARQIRYIAIDATQAEHRALLHIAERLEAMAGAVILPASVVEHVEALLEHAEHIDGMITSAGVP